MAEGILERLAAGPVLGDGGYLIELERRGWVKAGDWLPFVVLDNPAELRQLHREFIRAGAEVIQSLTFFGTPSGLDWGKRGHDAEALNRDGARLAKEIAGDGAMVAGTISNARLMTRDMPAAGSQVKPLLDKARRQFRDQARWLAEAGSDFLILETFFRLDEALIAIEEAKTTGLPVICTMTLQVNPVTWDGFTPAECAKRLRAGGADVVGVNCEQDTYTVRPLIRAMRDAVDGPIAAQPYGLRELPEARGFAGGAATWEGRQISRKEWGEFAAAAVEMGVGYLGACCGTGPSGIRGMAEALGKRTLIDV